MSNLQTIDTEVVEPVSGAIQTKTAYTTAMQIIRPRSLVAVQERMMQEAAIAGDEFYYSWSQGGSTIEGLTVGAAMAIARNMGNCAIPVTVDETKDTFIFTATFIDLETGFNLQRSFRQNKQSPKTKQGKDVYSGDRGSDIIFQIGQSKAIRNVVLNAVPSWLSKKVIEKAKENVVGKIAQMGVEKAKAHITKKAEALKVDIEVIENSFGKSGRWDTEKLVQISGALRAIEDGYATIADAFPPIKEDKKEENKKDLNSLVSDTGAGVQKEDDKLEIEID